MHPPERRPDPVDAVLFDLAGTLFSQRALLEGHRRLLADLAARAGIITDADTIKAAYRRAIGETYLRVHGDFYLHHDLWRGAFEGFLAALGAPVDHAVVTAAITEQSDMAVRDARLRPGVLDTLTALRAAGVHVGIVSNMDDDDFDRLVDALGLRDAADALLSSEHARSCKPHHAIYEQALLSAGGCEPARALFVGDTLDADIAGPRRLGFHTVLVLEEGHEYRPPPDAEHEPHHVIRSIPELLPIVGVAGP